MVEEVTHVAEAAGPLARLGVDWRLLLAQLVNFGLVLFVMWKWIYRPLLKVMDERTSRIEKSLKDADTAAADREIALAERDAIVTEARSKARGIIEEAEQLAKESREENVGKTRLEVEEIVKRGKEQLKADQATMVAEAKAEIAGAVMAVAEKVIGAKLDAKTDSQIVKRAIKDIE